MRMVVVAGGILRDSLGLIVVQRVHHQHRYMLLLSFFFWIRGNLTLQKMYFVGSGERVKSWLFQVFIKNTRPNLNLKPIV